MFIQMYFRYDMCSVTYWLLYSSVRCNSDYQVHVMERVLYIGWATSSRATVMTHLYVFKKKKKKKGCHISFCHFVTKNDKK